MQAMASDKVQSTCYPLRNSRIWTVSTQLSRQSPCEACIHAPVPQISKEAAIDGISPDRTVIAKGNVISNPDNFNFKLDNSRVLSLTQNTKAFQLFQKDALSL